jgi:MFS family permease
MLAVVAPVGALMVAIAVFALGHGLLGSLVPLRLEADGQAASVTGTVSAAYFAGLVAGAWYSPSVIRRVGHVRAFAGFAGLLAAGALALPLVPDPWSWAGLRLAYGASAGGIILVIESWLAGAAPEGWRARLLASYMAVFYLALAGSQYFLTVYGTAGFPPFNLVAILLALSLVPVALSRIAAPTLRRPVSRPLRELYALSPLAVVGCFASGIVLGAFYGLAPVFAARLGLDVEGVALVMSATILGGLALQWPTGYLSDLFDRRTVIIAVAATGAAACVLIVLTASVGLVLLVAQLAVFGGMAFTLYPLCLSHAADFLGEDGDIVTVASGLLLAYSMGAVAGPLAAGALFDLADGRGLFVVFALVLGAVAVFGLWRRTRRAAIPNAEQSGFVAVPRVSPAAYEIDPRRPPETT